MHFIQEHPFVVDFSVIKTVCAQLKIKLSEFEQVVENPEQSVLVLHEGLKRGSKLSGSEYKNTIEQTEELLNDQGTYFEFIQAFSADVLEIFSPDKKKISQN